MAAVLPPVKSDDQKCPLAISCNLRDRKKYLATCRKYTV
jgi:hypothetical protein